MLDVTFLIISFVTLASLQTIQGSSRSFTIDYDRDQFLKDGKPFRYVAGAMHYFRVPPEYWPDRMAKMRAAGLNTLETYIEWNSHEPEPGRFNFEGNLDIEKYLQLALEHNLNVILRPGPFIDAERDMGGLPYWLMTVNPSMKLRSSDPSYVFFVQRWFTVLLDKIKPYIYANGGPIITVQVENEYGSYSACDRDYTGWLRDFIRSRLGSDIVLFTTDGAGDGFLQCGKVPQVYATVDFGAGGNVLEAFKPQKHFEPSGPRVNSEFYPGWLDLWGLPHSVVDQTSVAKSLDEILALNASVSIYVFHGGTSFGFTSGALAIDEYKACVTSYDYDAPLNEAGDPTEKYFSLRNVISKYLPLPDYPVPKASLKANYGQVKMHYNANLWDLLSTPLAGSPVQSIQPVTFESMGQAHGYVLYCTALPIPFPDPSLLELKGLADRAYIYVDKEFVGILTRSFKLVSMPIQVAGSKELCILVENQGRIAYGGGIKDFKGLTGSVSLNGHVLSNWTQYPLPFNNSGILEKMTKCGSAERSSPAPRGTLSLFAGCFVIHREEKDLADTFLHLPGWHKGVAFLNGINLGRYWPVQGPQQTLYVPKFYLKSFPNKNHLVIIEQDRSPNHRHPYVDFIDYPILNGSTASLNRVVPFSRSLLHDPN